MAADYQKYEKELFRGNLSSEDTADYYDNWSEKYDKEVHEVLKAPVMAAKTAASLYDLDARSSVKILDVGAGTGLLAEELRKNGFKDIDGLDPSRGMLEKAKKKNLYNKYLCECLTKDSLQDSNGTYDCIVTSATMVPGHIPPTALEDFVRLVKKGGHIIITMRSDWEGAPEYVPSVKSVMETLEREGKWKKILQLPYNHYLHYNGFCFDFQVL